MITSSDKDMAYLRTFDILTFTCTNMCLAVNAIKYYIIKDYIEYVFTGGSSNPTFNSYKNNSKIYHRCDFVSGSEITPCNKINKPLVVYRFSGNIMKSITTLRT